MVEADTVNAIMVAAASITFCLGWIAGQQR